MTVDRPRDKSDADARAVLLDLPFRGRWLARNSPARRVPSHGTDLFGTTYAIDFIGVDRRGRSAPWGWRAALATERPDGFVGFGAAILAPAGGTVVAAVDGIEDHVARRSFFALTAYALSQGQRAKEGGTALAGNHVAIALPDGAGVVLVAHLQRGSVAVHVGDAVASGDGVGRCGNSGNSTQPHVHVQVTDVADWPRSRGLPMAFRRPDGRGVWMPEESEIVAVAEAVSAGTPKR